MKRLLLLGLTCIFVLKANAQCNSLSLSSNKTEICAPGLIEFKVTGAPKGSSYQWDIGQGNINGVDTIYGFYSNAKDVDVSVKVTMPNGQTCALKKAKMAKVHGAPTPSYTVSRKLLCDGPDSVQFKNTTPNASKISWVIDGTNYSDYGPNVTHTYSTSGQKDLFLIVIDNNGCRGILNDKKVVDVREDVRVDFIADKMSGCVPQTVQLSSTTSAKGEKIVGYSWSFEGQKDDSSKAFRPNKLVYSESGNYDISLSVTTDKGCVHEMQKEDYLRYGDTTSLDLVLSDTALCVGNSMTIKTKNVLPGTYIWNLKGATDTIIHSKSELGLTYGNTGKFDIGLYYSHNSCISQKVFRKKIEVNSVEVDFFSKDNYHCKLPHTTHFTNTSKTSDPTQVNYEWTYFQHRTKIVVAKSDKKDDAHTNTDWGVYDVRLVATDANGCTDTAFKEQYLRVDSIRPAIHARPRVACVDQTISFFNATPKSSYLSTDTFYWKFFKKDDVSIKKISRDDVVQHSYGDTGLYDVMFYAGNTIGCVDSIFMPNYVDIIIPNIDYNVTDPTVCAGENLRLEAKSTPKRAQFEYFWKLEKLDDASITMDDDTAIYEPNMVHMGEYKLTYLHHLAGGCRDSVVVKDVVKVNGLVGIIDADSFRGCAPFQTRARLKVIKNYHFGSSADTIGYDWGSQYVYSADDPHSGNPMISVAEEGVRRINLIAYNSAGCKATIASHPLAIGVVAEMGHVESQICVGTTVGIRDASNEVATHSRWSILPANFKASITKNDSGIDLHVQEAGLFTVRLIASRYGICSDTVEFSIESQEVISDFIAVDTHLYCAPVYAQFQAKSTGADSFFWNFGEGTTIQTVDRQIANIYNKNSGWSDGYDITLISKNKLGCVDTLTKNDLVKVLGPVPKFELSNNYGCDPLEVNFVDKSRDVHSYLMDYRDGTTLDSNGLYSHVYTIENSGDRQSYRPALYARDSLGCVALFEAEELVSVLRKPDMKVSVAETKGCAPLTLQFSHTTNNTSKEKWFLGEKLISEEESDKYLIDSADNYELKLVVTNNNLCQDTAIVPIDVYREPSLAIVTSGMPCLNQVMNFNVQTDSSTQVIQYLWNFDDGTSGTDRHRRGKTTNTYTEPGTKEITLTIVDQYQCSAKAEETVIISDPGDIDFPMIKQVTVTENQKVKIEWFEVKDTLIQFNRIYKDGFVDANGNPAVFYEQKNNEKLELIDQNADPTMSNCYTMVNIDRCDFESRSYAPHCPVILSLDKSGPSKLMLHWTSYKGWLEVQAYDIYRAMKGGEYELINTVEGYENSWEDQFLCDAEYQYYVVAKFRDRRSRSNTVNGIPVYVRLKDKPFVKNVTVLDNGSIEIQMNKVENPNWEAHILSKYNETKTQLLEVIETYDDVYIDNNADVANQSYVYQLIEKDRCGEVTLPGFTGKSILMEGEYTDDKSILNWNSYEKWEKGVENYVLQIRRRGKFEEIAELAPSQLVFNDGDPHTEIHGEHCYRVMAISRNEEPDTSYSNVVCTVGPSKVWVPNAFTPNDDGKNDVFMPVGQFLKDWDDGSYREYSMTIYNSWGEKLFETNDIHDAWDGTYQGQLVQQDAYYYNIEISGVDQKVFRKKGTVILIK